MRRAALRATCGQSSFSGNTDMQVTCQHHTLPETPTQRAYEGPSPLLWLPRSEEPGQDSDRRTRMLPSQASWVSLSAGPEQPRAGPGYHPPWRCDRPEPG